jgi:UDP-2,4-diacetamido-2,4,6-trideoxy-beta-L-altropyranose hydrolase
VLEKKSKLYFRVDANPEIGLGHLTRCIALAQMLKKTFNIIFICKDLPENTKKTFNTKHFLLEKVETYFTIPDFLSSNDIIVLDGYHFDIKYQKKIKAIGCKLICIDDLHTEEYVADLIINHTPGIKESQYKAKVYTQFALGINYTLLRPSFLRQAKIGRKIGKIQTVIICFGGSDNNNITQRALNVLLNCNNFNKIIVVTGFLYQFLDELKISIQGIPQVEHYHGISEKKMLSLMLLSELAIVPSSGLTFEALAAGCKVISGYYINNQFEIYKGFKKLNAIIGAGRFQEIELIKALKISNNFECTKVIDGRSPIHILKKIKSLKHVYSDISRQS